MIKEFCIDFKKSDAKNIAILEEQGIPKKVATDILHLVRQQFGPKQKRGYVCSPCRAANRSGVIKNMEIARRYCEIISDLFNLRARAPHAWLAHILDDNYPDERQLALEIGLEMIKQSDMLFVCGNRITEGMASEIKYADELKIPIMTFNAKLGRQISKMIRRSCVTCLESEGKTKLSQLARDPREVA